MKLSMILRNLLFFSLAFFIFSFDVNASQPGDVKDFKYNILTDELENGYFPSDLYSVYRKKDPANTSISRLGNIMEFDFTYLDFFTPGHRYLINFNNLEFVSKVDYVEGMTSTGSISNYFYYDSHVCSLYFNGEYISGYSGNYDGYSFEFIYEESMGYKFLFLDGVSVMRIKNSPKGDISVYSILGFSYDFSITDITEDIPSGDSSGSGRDYTEELNKINDNLGDINADLDKTNDNLDDINSDLDKANDNLDDINSDLDKANDNLDDINLDLDRANEELGSINNTMKIINDRQIENERIISDSSEDIAGNISGFDDSLKKAEDDAFGESKDTIADINFNLSGDGGFGIFNLFNFIDTLGWISSMLSIMARVNEFNLVIAVSGILVVAVIILGIRRLWG